MLFEKGKSGNPAGRPKGARNRLGEAFLSDLEAHWRENGRQALEGALAESPAAYVRAVASLMPKEMVIERPLEGLTEDDIAALIDEIQAAKRARGLGGEAEASDPQPEQDQPLPTLQ